MNWSFYTWASSQHGRPKEIPLLGGRSRSCHQCSSDLDLEVSECPFYRIVLVKAGHKFSPNSIEEHRLPSPWAEHHAYTGRKGFDGNCLGGTIFPRCHVLEGAYRVESMVWPTPQVCDCFAVAHAKRLQCWLITIVQLLYERPGGFRTLPRLLAQQLHIPTIVSYVQSSASSWHRWGTMPAGSRYCQASCPNGHCHKGSVRNFHNLNTLD